MASFMSSSATAEPVETPAKPAKQEKVKMGFQLYRPPTLLAQASSEVRCSHTVPVSIASVEAHVLRSSVCCRACRCLQGWPSLCQPCR